MSKHHLSYSILTLFVRMFSQKTALPLRNTKPKSTRNIALGFVDLRRVRVVAGKGGDGCISFLSLWSNEYAGPDGGDGGNGGHVIFESTTAVTDLRSISSVIRAEDGVKGGNRDCHGKNAPHCVVKVPVGTIVRNDLGRIVGDLETPNLRFLAARGGAGGRGNHFFISDTEQSPEIAEVGAIGEDFEYVLEIRSMADVGLIGYPNAGKSTLLRAISRARPKVAPYPFTTLQPHVGIIEYSDYTQISVADLPGLINDSHKNRGLGIEFLRHIERCSALLYVIDMASDCAVETLESLQFELRQFSEELMERSQIVVANKIDQCDDAVIDELRRGTKLPVIAVSAKMGKNLTALLLEIRRLYDFDVRKR